MSARASSVWLVRAVSLAAAALIAAGCGKKSDAPASSENPPASDQSSTAAPAATSAESGDVTRTDTTVSGERDSRTQYDLAVDIKRAETARGDDSDLVWNEVRRDYHGKRFTWTVLYLPVLCREAARCNVAPFDRTGADKKIIQGWMPRLEMSDAEFAKLKNQCGTKARCQFRFEGTLYHLTLSPDHLTALRFNDVKIHAM